MGAASARGHSACGRPSLADFPDLPALPGVGRCNACPPPILRVAETLPEPRLAASPWASAEWGLDAPKSFLANPHRTVVTLGLPILGSLLAEPLTGLVDTAFIARLGSEPLAALGVGTMVLSAIFWGFSFLGVATQTLVASHLGSADRAGRRSEGAARMCLVAVAVAMLAGVAIACAGVPLATVVARAMGASGPVEILAADYLEWRLVGTPPMLAAFAALGALRGAHDMAAPLRVAVGMNALNVALDPILIFGWGPVPAMGVTGAAIATTASQYVGAAWALSAAFSRLGRPAGLDLRDARKLLAAGANLVLRAASLYVFLLMGTRKATLIGPAAGAVHHVIRTVWFFNALFLDSFAILAQSLVAHFLARQEVANAREVARITLWWGFGCGSAICIAMLALAPGVQHLYIPPAAVSLFATPWVIAALSQPISGVTFASDGIHFGSGDFGFLRNAVLSAMAAGGALVVWADASQPGALVVVWLGFAVWTSLRAAAGTLRIWPGGQSCPLGSVRARPEVGKP